MFWLIYIAGIILDQLSKVFIRTNFKYLESVPLIPGVFHITYARNSGAAFSILEGKSWFFIIIAFSALLFMFYILKQLPQKHKGLKVALALLASGTTGNLIDRIINGWVIDFLDFRIWPVFNLADCLIVLSVGIILWHMLFKSKDLDSLFSRGGKT